MFADVKVGRVLMTGHARDRMERHGIEKKYVHSLIDRVEEWQESYDRVVGYIDDGGVTWRIVLEPEHDHESHDWDLVTVVPEEVDLTEAKRQDQWDEKTAINLKLYANQEK